jgi:nucleotide-binding universal stress UspA family protein
VIDYSRSNRVDLIVLGAEHRRFSDSSVLGTTVVRVTRHAPVPVLTVMNR